MNPRVGLVVLTAALLGCGAPEGQAATAATISRDSVGVRVVDIGAGDRVGLPIWNLEDTLTAEIRPQGEPGGDPLLEVVGAVRLTDGRIAVANGRVPMVQVFGPDGGFLYSVGRTGGGPGEFRGIDSLLPFRGDSLAVFDAARQRVVIFSGNGTWGRDIPLRNHVGRTRLIGAFPDGSVLYSTAPFSAGSGVWRDSATYVRVWGDGTPADTLGRWPTEERYSVDHQGRPVRGVRPFGLVTWAVPDGETVHVGTGDPFVIETVALHGQPVRRVRAPARGAHLAESEIARYERERLEGIRGTRAYPLVQAVLASGAVPYPERLPAHGRLIVDAQGHLWVERVPIPGDTSVAWVVFEPDGHAAAMAVVPAELQLIQIDAGAVLALHRDQSGLESIRLHRLERATARRSGRAGTQRSEGD